LRPALMWQTIPLTALILVGSLGQPSAEETGVCQGWSAQISEHLDWVCARTAGGANSGHSERPSLALACRAMEEHVADLLNQHRRVDVLDDPAFNAALLMFQDGQSACRLLAIYGSVPVPRLASLLR
jgi:hypothetical protein